MQLSREKRYAPNDTQQLKDDTNETKMKGCYK